jgi:hypothetical protein
MKPSELLPRLRRLASRRGWEQLGITQEDLES